MTLLSLPNARERFALYWWVFAIASSPVWVFAQESTPDAGSGVGLRLEPPVPIAADGGAPEQPPRAAEPEQPAPPRESTEATEATEATASEAASPPEVEASAPADASTKGEPDSTMVVTAQRYEQDVQKAPVTVTAFGPRALDQRGMSNLQDVGKFTPNLELHMTNRPAGGSSAYAAYIRGIGTGDFQFPTDPGVGLYVDDVYMARTVGGLLSTDADAARIEVIKGPQGTLFGRNTIGGALNVVTSKPLLEGPATGSGLVRFGSYGRHDFAFNVNAPIVSQIVGAKLSLSTQNLAGYGERLLDDQRANDESRFVARAGLLFKLGQRVEIRIDADYSRQDQNPPNGQFLSYGPKPMSPTAAKVDKYNMVAAPALNSGLNLPAGSTFGASWLSPNRYDNYALQPVHDRYQMGGGSLKLTYAAAEWLNIKSITAARVLSSSIRVDGDQTPYPVQSTGTELDDTQLSEELQFSGHVWGKRLRYLVGLYAFRESGKSRVDTQSFHGLFENEPMPIDADAGDTLARLKLKATSLAVFSQETLELVPDVHLTFGARLNHDRKDYDYAVSFTQRDAVQVPQSHASASWNSFTPKLGLDYSPVEPIMLYASYANGFKSGGFSSSNKPENPTPKYDPEKVTAYELGVKTHWFGGRRLITDLSVFYNDYRDIQLTVQWADPITNANVRTTENAGRSHVKGFEGEITATPVEGFSLNAGVGYVDAKLSSLTEHAVMSGFKVGDRLPQIPAFSVNAGAQLALNVGVGELTLRADASWKGSQYLTAVDPSSYQKPYALYSARVSFVPTALDGLEVSLYGINLTDTVYYVYRATPLSTGQQLAVAGAPRLIFATARYMF